MCPNEILKRSVVCIFIFLFIPISPSEKLPTGEVEGGRRSLGERTDTSVQEPVKMNVSQEQITVCGVCMLGDSAAV
jgi:hypothetical protein